MKKIYLPLLLLAFSFSFLSAQQSAFVVNGEMEVWDDEFNAGFTTVSVPEYPVDWMCGNFINGGNSLDPGASDPDVSVFKVEGGAQYDGAFSCEINTVYYEDNPVQGLVPDTSGLLITGDFTVDGLDLVPNIGYAYTGLPEKFEMYAKYEPQNNDFAFADIEISRWNNDQRETIAEGYIQIDASTDYEHYEVTLNYIIQDVEPDTATIIISSSNFADPQIGSKLTIDNLVFSGGTVGVEYIMGRKSKVNYYPNPATEIVSFEFDVNHPVNTMEIYTLEGRLVETIGINSAQLKNIQVANYDNGLYMFRCIDNDNRIVETGKFLVKH